MKGFKKALCFLLAVAVALALRAPVFAAVRPADADPEDGSGRVIRVAIPNQDGTFTTLEGEDAQSWYDRAVAEGEQRPYQERELDAGGEEEVRGKGPSVISIAISMVVLGLITRTMLSGWSLKYGEQ